VCWEERAMPLIGTFETMPIPELLQWIGIGRKTGTLQITTDKGLAVLAFQEGELTFSASSDRGQTLSKLLVESGLLTDEMHEQARAVCRETGIGLGKALKDLNVLREDELLNLMRRKVENELLGLLQTDEGQVVEAHSISAGLDYPSVGPERMQDGRDPDQGEHGGDPGAEAPTPGPEGEIQEHSRAAREGKQREHEPDQSRIDAEGLRDTRADPRDDPVVRATGEGAKCHWRSW